MRKPLGVGCDAADVEPLLYAGLVLQRALAVHHPRTSSARASVCQAVQLPKGVVAAYFNTSGIFLYRLVAIVLYVGPVMSLPGGEELTKRVGQLRLVVLDRQHVVSALLLHLLSDGRMCVPAASIASTAPRLASVR